MLLAKVGWAVAKDARAERGSRVLRSFMVAVQGSVDFFVVDEGERHEETLILITFRSLTSQPFCPKIISFRTPNSSFRRSV